MDNYKGRRIAYYDFEEIAEYFRIYPEKYDSKHGWELRVGCILSKCREKIYNELPRIGYLVKGQYLNNDEIPRPEIHELISGNLIEDEDVDIFLKFRDSQGKIQITRFEEHSAQNSANDGLIELIKKKCIIQPDKYLALVVIVDYTFDFKDKDLRKDLKQVNVPYGSIYLVGQINEPKHGYYHCRQVYPDFAVNDVEVSI